MVNNNDTSATDYADEVTPPEPSTAMTRFIAFMGRDPNWSSSAETEW
jgi:hypothetical protein